MIRFHLSIVIRFTTFSEEQGQTGLDNAYHGIETKDDGVGLFPIPLSVGAKYIRDPATNAKAGGHTKGR